MDKGTEFRFNFLNNLEVKTYTEELLLQSQIPKGNVDFWFEFVEKYNEKLNDFVEITSKGWVQTSINEYSKIKFTETLNNWSQEEINADLNCRISLFSLTRGKLVSGAVTYKTTFISEINKMNDSLKYELTFQEQLAYNALFDAHSLDGNDIFINDLSQIEDKNDNLSLLRIYWQKSNNPEAVMAHTALLIKRNNNFYVVEKKNPLYPYQVAEFSNLTGIIDYYLMVYRDTIGDIFIVKDTELLYHRTR